MYAEIVEKIDVNGVTYAGLSNGKVITAYSASLVDVETTSISLLESAFSRFFETIATNVLVRVRMNSRASFDENSDHSRKDALSAIGSIENDLVFVFELDSARPEQFIKSLRARESGTQVLRSQAERLASSFDLGVLRSFGIKFQNASAEALEQLFPAPSTRHLLKTSIGIDTGKTIFGYARLVKQGTHALTPLNLSAQKDLLPLPFRMSCTYRRLAAEKSEALLRRRSNQNASGTDLVASQKYQDTQETLTDVALNGASLFQMEVLAELERGDETTLRNDLNLACQKLRVLGDWSVETFGAYPSFLAAQIGSDQHFPILETNEVIPSYLPVWTRGKTRRFQSEPEKRALALLRRDGSTDYLDIFDSRFDNYSACIFGKSGRGKSVLTNLLTRALHHDDNVQILKVDVGGSHSKETRLLGGREYVFSLSEPSGINPFGILRESDHSEDICGVLSTFLGVLLLEEGESTLSKALRAEIERAVAEYSGSRPHNPSMTDFFNAAVHIPRCSLLERWTDKGAFKNAFSTTGVTKPEQNRLQYYNFAQIFQANDPDFGQGGLAAVMAQFNLDLMSSKGKKLVFIADETPFFIERCFSFFKFSTANVRKFGGSFITIAQKSSDVVVNDDAGILDNSAHKFLFSIDGDKESFGKRLKLEDQDIERVDGLLSRKGEFSEVLYHDAVTSKILRIELTAEEYWRVTSSQSDNEKLSKLMAAVPGLKLEEAIKCLTL